MTAPRGLAAAARFEADSRAAHYPARVAAGRITAEAAQTDYQAWTVIADWLATDRFTSIDAAGCADPSASVGLDGRTTRIISWPECEAAAAAAVKAAARAVDRALAAGDEPAARGHGARLSALKAIHRAVQLRRESIDAINAEFRKRAPVGLDGRATKAPKGVAA